MRYPDIDRTGDVIHIRQTVFFRHGKHHEIPDGDPRYVFLTPKTDDSFRLVDFSPVLKKELRACFMASADKHGLIFQTSNGTPIDPHNAHERWFAPAVERAVKKAEKDQDRAAADNLNGLRLHDLRHTFGSWKIVQGEDVVSKQMGHSKVSTTCNVYAHLLDPMPRLKPMRFLLGNPRSLPSNSEILLENC